MKTMSLYIMAALMVLQTGRTAFGVELPLICPAPLVADPPVLDGKTDDAAWRNAYPMSGFVVLSQPGTAAVKQTAFRAVHTAAALYVAVECREPDMGQLQTATQDFWKVDSVEIFIQPKAGGPYWQMVVSSDGGREESRDMEKNPNTSSWDAKVCRGGDFYGMEVKLPFDIFGARPASGEVWRFNVARNSTTPDSDRYSTWSHLAENFHEPDNFGRVVFVGAGLDKAAMNCEIFKRQFETVAVWIKAYKDSYQEYDKEYFDYITKFLVEIGWEELRQKAARIDGFSPEEAERAKQALGKIAGRLSELEMIRSGMLKKRIFNDANG